jgi:hypothetical protein
VFLGTPHKGSNAATLGTLVGRIVNTFVAATSAGLQTRATRTDLLDYLSYDSKHLQDLAVSVRNRLADLTVISFYESEAQYPLSVVSLETVTWQPRSRRGAADTVCRLSTEIPPS